MLDWTSLLLADPSPCLRWRVLRELIKLPADDDEVIELAGMRVSDPLASEILAFQDDDGAWKPGSMAMGRASSNKILTTALALSRLGFLGFDVSLPAVERGAAFLFSQQQADGSWPLHSDYQADEPVDIGKDRYTSMSLQTSLPLRGLAACGYATDPRAEKAYEWLLAQRLPEGVWPTGMAAGVYGYVAGYRRMPHSRWGCRSNTTGALICLALHPERRTSPEARRALDHLLARETQEAFPLGFEVARLVGAEVARGFITFYARFDLGLILWLCSQVRASKGDQRVAGLVQFIMSQRGSYGLWEYSDKPQASRWVTFDLIRSLEALEENLDWVNLEPSTPFQPYPKKLKRF